MEGKTKPNRKSGKGMTKFIDIVKEQDVFTKQIRFTFDKGKTEFKTGFGGACSIIMFVLVCAFAVQRIVTMV